MNPYGNMPVWTPKQSLASADLNRLSRGISAAIGIRVDPASGLTLVCDETGQRIARGHATPIWGTLSGSSSPYTFTEALEGAGGAWASGARTGTAYEVNGVAGLGGKVARLFPDRHSAWRFQWRPTVCGCSGLPTTLYGSWTYTPTNSSCSALAQVTLNFTLTYNTSTRKWASPSQSASGITYTTSSGTSCGLTESASMILECVTPNFKADIVCIYDGKVLMTLAVTTSSPFYASGSITSSTGDNCPMSITVSA